MNKKNIMPIAVLTVICVIVAVLIGAVNMITAPIIESAEQERVYASKKEVLDGNVEPVAKLPDGAPNSVTEICNVSDYATGDFLGNVVTVTVKGYKDNISVTVGIDEEGKVTKVIVTSQAESHGKAEMENYPDRFAGKNSEEAQAVEVISGATVTSNAIKSAVNDAMVALGYAEAAPELPRTDEELLSLAKGLINGSFKDITPDNNDGLVKRIYKETGGKGYVIYTHTYAAYGGGLETETLIAVDNNGNITGINNLLWLVGHDKDDTPPAPSEEEVAAFFSGFVGKNIDDINSVELVTNATGTATNVRAAVTDALRAVPSDNHVPRIVGIAILAAAAVSAAAMIIIYKKRRSLK